MTDYLSTLISLTNIKDNIGKPLLLIEKKQLEEYKQAHKELYDKRATNATNQTLKP